MRTFTIQQIVVGLLVVVLVVGGGYVLHRHLTPRDTETPITVPTSADPVTPQPTQDPRVSTIGHSVQGRAIEAYTYGNGGKHLLFVGGMHGGYEWNSVLLAHGFIDHMSGNKDVVGENLTVSIIPSLNPDGLFNVIGKEGRFTTLDVPATFDAARGRFNAHSIDLNRNFDCKWQPKSTWRGRAVSAGTAAFSEPEAQALRDFVLDTKPVAVIFWHSQANAVYASECTEGILPGTRTLMETYAQAASYPAVDTFDAYPVTGDAEGWLASIGIPAITVELASHESIEWDRNLLGVTALLTYYRTEKTSP